MADVIISEFTTLNQWRYTGDTTCSIRTFCSETYSASDESIVLAGDEYHNYFETLGTVADGVASFDLTTLKSTNDRRTGADPRYTSVIYSGTGSGAVKRDVLLSDYEVPASPASTDWDAIRIANEVHYPILDTSYLTRDQILALVPAAVTTPAATTQLGVGLLSAPATNSALPVFIGENDDRITAERFSSIYSADIPTAIAAIAAIVGSTPTTVVVSKSNATATTTYSVPSNILIRMVGAGKITVSSGRVLTFGGGFQAEGHRQRFAGSGLVRFTGTNTPDIFHIGWWGCVGDGVADDVIPYQAAIDATPDGYTLYHPNSFNCSITSKLKCNDRIALKLGNPSNFNSPYAGQTGKITWNGPANGAMLEMIDSNSCVVRGLYFAMTGSNTANTAAYGIFTTADYGLTLSGVTTNTNSPTVTFTGIGNGFMVDSLPNGDAVHRGRNIIIGGNTYVIASISDATAPGTLTLTTNALANVSGGTASIPHPQGYIHSSSSHIFEYLNFNWTTASTNVAYRTAICNDLYAGVNHERIVLNQIVVYGNAGQSLALDRGIAVSAGGYYDSGSVDLPSPLIGYGGGANFLQAEARNCFFYGVSFGFHGWDGSISNLQGSFVAVPLFGAIDGIVDYARIETSTQFFHGFGGISFKRIKITNNSQNGHPVFEFYGGSSDVTMEGVGTNFGFAYVGSGVKMVHVTAPTNATGHFINCGVMDTNLSCRTETDYTGFNYLEYFSNSERVFKGGGIYFIDGTTGPLPTIAGGALLFSPTVRAGMYPAVVGSGTGAYVVRQGDKWYALGVSNLVGTVTYNPGLIADGASVVTTVPVGGAQVGDPARAGFSSITSQGWEIKAEVLAINNVTVTLTNRTGGAVDLPEGTLKAVVTNVV